MNPDTLAMLIVIPVAVVIVLLLAVCAVLVVRDTIRGRGNWGIPTRMPTACPRCREPLPMVRMPTSFRQAMWGGWTCGYCDLEIDKYGNPLPGQEEDDIWEVEEEDAPPPRRRPPDERFRGRSDR